MSDLLGLLPLPMTTPAAGSAVGDPLLDVTLAFLKAVINAKTKLGWKAVCAYPTKPTTEPLPVSFVFPHCPTNESFTTGRLPALFAWRAPDHAAKTTQTQDWLLRQSTINLLWVPPRATQEQARIREPFKNAVSAAIDWAFVRGRDPSWVVDGDTYYDAQDYGSVWVHEAKVFWHQIRQIEPHPIQIAFDDGPQETFDALLAQLDVQEVLQFDPTLYGVPFNYVQGTVKLPPAGDNEDRLSVQTYHFELALDSATPDHGPAEGGTVVTISGKQFVEDMQVTFGTALSPSVTFVDESTIEAETPAGTAGAAVDIIVLAPSGVEKTLTNGFTYDEEE